jgi:hypothetical protein
MLGADVEGNRQREDLPTNESRKGHGMTTNLRVVGVLKLATTIDIYPYADGVSIACLRLEESLVVSGKNARKISIL